MAKQVLNNGETHGVIRGKANDNFNELYNSRDTHLAENVTQTIFATRDMSLGGIQTITGLLGMPKRIEIRAATDNWVQLTFSVGSYEVNGSKQSALALASSNVSYTRNDRVCCLFNGSDKFNLATLQNLTETQFDLLWAGSASLPTGTVNLQIIAYYHG